MTTVELAIPHRVGLFVPVPQSSSLTVSTRVHLSVHRQEHGVILTEHHLCQVKSYVQVHYLNKYQKQSYLVLQVHNYGLILTQNHLYQGKPDVHYLHEYQRGQNSLM